MANDVQPEEDYDDGLAPPPELPTLAISQTGTVEQAKCLQISNSVPEQFRGPWYHETYTGQESFDNQHEEWTWFTRSPSGGTIWGDRVSQVYVIDTLADSRAGALAIQHQAAPPCTVDLVRLLGTVPTAAKFCSAVRRG